MSDYGIISLGLQVPAARLDRKSIAAAHRWIAPGLASEAHGERAFCNWDEDVITMAVDAVRDCVEPGDRAAIRRIVLASTNLPFADLSNSGILSAALGLHRDTATLDVSGTVRGGTSALLDALECRLNNTVVVASDAPPGKPGSTQEMRYGSAAVAVHLGRGEVVASYLGGMSRTEAFVDHFRARYSKFDYAWEERWVRDTGYAVVAAATVRDLLERLAISATEVKFCLAHSVVAGGEKAMAKAAGLTAAQFISDTQESCGYAGTAAPLLQLAIALERAQPGDIILVAGFGYGCDVLAFRATEAAVKVRTQATASNALAGGYTETAYLRYLAYAGGIDLDLGMRAEFDPKTSLTQAFRSHEQLNAFVAGECIQCGTVQFPVMSACVKCASTAATKPHPLADEPAKLVTFTADHMSFHLSPPFYMGLVQFAGGARVFMEVIDVPQGAELSVGLPVRAVFRVKDRDHMRGYIRYFWKVAPVHTSTIAAERE